MNAAEAPITIERARARVLMTTMATMVLSGSSNTNIRAKMPRKAPTFTVLA